MPHRFVAVTLVVLALLLALVLPAGAWGPDGHFLVNRAAARQLPEDMPEFFRAAAAQLEWLGYEPDRWREDTEWALKASQTPDHFIDLERVGPGFEFPPDRYAYYRALEQLRAAAPVALREQLYPEAVGLQPYIAMEVYERLKVAFRSYRRLLAEGRDPALVQGAAITWAGWLGHYVADAAQPHHTTIHYDGWVGDDSRGFPRGPGLHWKFESDFVVRNLPRLQLEELLRPPRVLDDPFHAYLDFIRATHAQVERLYELEAAGAIDGDAEEAIEFTRRRLAAGAQMLRDLWYTAWAESARPVEE